MAIMMGAGGIVGAGTPAQADRLLGNRLLPVWSGQHLRYYLEMPKQRYGLGQRRGNETMCILMSHSAA